MPIIGFDSNILLNYYSSRLNLGGGTQFNSPQNAQAAVTTPWDFSYPRPTKEREDVQVRSEDPYFDPDDLSLYSASGSAVRSAQSQLQALVNKSLSRGSSETDALSRDNDKLFALYKALHRVSYIAKMANREGAVNGLRPGLNLDFQDGLSQIRSFVDQASFANLTVLNGQRRASTETSALIPYSQFDYTGKGIVQHSGWSEAVPGVSATDIFTVSVTKDGVATDVIIDLANVSGPLTLDNINGYVNQKLAAAGFTTKFTRVQTGGAIVDDTAVWGIRIKSTANETVTLSSSQATPAIYVAGSSGATATQQGRLVKFSELDTAPQSVFSANISPDAEGTANARSVAVDSNGNAYVVGDTTGDFDSQFNQGSSDVFLTKYDSAGQVQWTRLLGSAGEGDGYAVTVDPTGGVVVAGSVTGDLTPTSIGDGTDSFVAKYDDYGNQEWLHQATPILNDSARSVAVDSVGNVYFGGAVEGVIGSGQTSAGGKDAYVSKLDSTGSVVYQRQFGTSGTDSVAQIAIASDGNLLVASVANGQALLTKFDATDGVSAAMWQVDLGALENGALGGLVVSGSNVYLSGTTSNAALNAGGMATIANASSGGRDAFVFHLNDLGASASADFVSYVGTSASEQGGGIALSGGNIYLTGTTKGTFAGQTRNLADVPNMFVAQFNSTGALNYTHQYGGVDGQSEGFAIAVDTQGASVLDVLGLPRGEIDLNQPNSIESQTTARAGDYFTLRIESPGGARSVKITLAAGETLRSLATKINVALLFNGKASAIPSTGGQRMRIAVDPGVRVELIAGPKDFDALAGLGLAPQILVGRDTDNSSDTSSSADKEIIGLAIGKKLNLLTKSNASHADSALQAAMAQIKQVYARINTPEGKSTAAQFSGPVPAYLQTRLAEYQTALLGLSSFSNNITSI